MEIGIGLHMVIHRTPAEVVYRSHQDPLCLFKIILTHPVNQSFDPVGIKLCCLGFDANVGRLVDGLLHLYTIITHQTATAGQSGRQNAICDIVVHPTIWERISAQMRAVGLLQTLGDPASVILRISIGCLATFQPLPDTGKGLIVFDKVLKGILDVFQQRRSNIIHLRPPSQAQAADWDRCQSNLAGCLC